MPGSFLRLESAEMQEDTAITQVMLDKVQAWQVANQDVSSFAANPFQAG